MNKLLKNMKKVVSIMLVMSMIFTSHAFVTFAEGVDNAETTTQETTVRRGELDEVAPSGVTTPEEDIENVDADTEETIVAEDEAGSQAHPYNSKKETTVAEEEAGFVDEDSENVEVDIKETTVEADTEETTVGADIIRPEDETEEPTETTDYAEEPEEDVKETETTIEEIEETTTSEDEAGEEETTATEKTTIDEKEEISLDLVEETKVNNDIYGAGSRKFILVGVNSSDEVTAYTVDETTSKETWKAGISSSGIVDYDVNIGTYYRLASGTNLDVDDVKSQYEKYRDEDWRSFTWLENEFDTWKAGSEDKAIGYSYGPSAPKNFNVLYINKSSNKTSYEILSGVDEVSLDFKLEELFTLMSDDLKGWHVFTPDDPTDPSSVIENYNPDYSGTAEYAGTKEGLKQAYNDWNNDPTDNIFIGGMFESSTTYTVKYNQDLPTGYTLSGGMTWYTDSTTTDLTGSPIILKGSADMTCEDTSGNTRTLQGWNTQPELKGNTFNFGDTFNDPVYFDSDPTCTLYAMWSDPVGPGPTGDWYWYLEGDTIIHYTNTYEAGRTPVEYDTNGAVVYNGLSDSIKYNKIETAVFDNKIVAPKAQSFFKEFLSLKTITDIDNLDTSSATSFKEMFASCGSLETLDVSSLNTSNATDMESMFQWCNTLTSLDVSNFDTSKVTNMVSMFNSCKKIEELDLTSFKTSNVKSMAAMFTNCEELTTIKTTVDFIVDQVTDLIYNNLFEGNTKLVGGQGTTYDASKLKKEYARIDQGPTSPGYFTGTIPPTPTKTVTKIAIKTNPTKTTYDSGDAFDPTGLVIKVTYSDSSTEDIDYATHASDFSFNPTTITKSGNVVVTYSGKPANVAVKVNGGPTPPGPTPPSPGGGGTGGGTSGGGSSDPAHGPMGDLTKEMQQQQQQQQKATDKKQAKKVENDELADLLKSYNENHDAPMVNARDDNGNVGHGQWLRIPGSTIWYFLTSDFNQNVTNVNANDAPNPTHTDIAEKKEGFLVDGWFNLGWDGVDRWYRFDENGIMLMGWWIEDGKTYFLQTDENDNWYGKAMTGTQVIDGITYNFDENGVLIS